MQPFERLISNATTIYIGVDRDEAAYNAANATGGGTIDIDRLSLLWPAVRKFDNDILVSGSPSPFTTTPNPGYVWNSPISDGQVTSYAVASKSFDVSIAFPVILNIFLVAFADNAMKAQISLFEQIGTSFSKVGTQPAGLGNIILIAGTPNVPVTGLTEGAPFNWQDVRVYSTLFQAPPPTIPPFEERIFKIVISFEVTNYLPLIPNATNPAGLQFLADIFVDASL